MNTRLNSFILLAGIAALACFATTIACGMDPGFNFIRDVILFNIPFLSCIWLCRMRAKTSSEGSVWNAFALGVGMYTAGNILFNLQTDIFPKWNLPQWTPDLFYLALFPAAYYGISRLVVNRISRFHLSMLLDGVLASLAGTIFIVTFYWPYLVRANAHNYVTAAINLSYPIGDFVMILVLVASACFLRYGRDRNWLLLTASFALFALGDIIYLSLVVSNKYQDGTILDLTWPLAVLILGYASTQKWQRRKVGELGEFVVMAVPLGSALTAALFLGWSEVFHKEITAFASLVAVATLILACLRIAMSFYEVKHLVFARTESRTDEITGLGNRRAIMEKLDELSGEVFTLCLVDLDGFKRVNDVLGHASGDKILTEVGRRIDSFLYDEDFGGRLGGDEFVIIIRTDLEKAEKRAKKLHQMICEDYQFDGIKATIGASMGLSLSPRDGKRVDLLRLADNAMYQVKELGGGVRVHDPEINGEMGTDQIQLVEDLRAAISCREGLVVHYQPIMEIGTKEMLVEALVRWEHPTHGMIAPNDFIPLAEQSGLMQKLTWNVLDISLADCVRMRQEGVADAVSVNLSASVLLDSSLPDIVRTELARYNLPGSALRLELTETMIIRDPQAAQRSVDNLREMGVKVMVDDYGTGYSSISHLHHLQVDGLKLDRSFIQKMDAGSKQSYAIIKSTIEMAHALDLRVVAEGVETETALQTLKDLGCDYIQGYHISRPLPYDQLAAWSRQNLTA